MSAYDVFRKALNETERLAEQIARLADTAFPDDPKDIHWGHIGDIYYVNERLREIIEHFR